MTITSNAADHLTANSARAALVLCVEYRERDGRPSLAVYLAGYSTARDTRWHYVGPDNPAHYGGACDMIRCATFGYSVVCHVTGQHLEALVARVRATQAPHDILLAYTPA